MSASGPERRRRGLVALSELVGPVIEPLTARRGFAIADMLAVWPEIVGPVFAGCTRPERIAWPKATGDEASAGTLFLRADGPRAVLLQHELPQVIERINAFFGYGAIRTVRIVQGPVGEAHPGRPEEPPLTAADEASLAGSLSTVEDETLRDALDRLGRGVLRSRRE